MGITKKDCQLLFYSRKKLGVSFEKTLMLGRLYLYASRNDIQEFISMYGAVKKLAEVSFNEKYSEPLFQVLGAIAVDSLDYSDYEMATVIHDLNDPIPEPLKNKFNCIVDGGTIEHVFNFPVAIRSCMEALTVGGHYIGITPANNQMGHGFYQFSPELYYRIFSAENGFRVRKMLLTPNDVDGEWYEVADPAQVRSRVMIVNPAPLTLVVVAEKIASCEIFASNPYQSDYSASWASSLASHSGQESALKGIYKRVVPDRIKSIARNVYDFYRKKKIDTRFLGTIDSNHLKKVDL